MTLSLILRDPDTGEFGSVIASSSPAVAARCLNLADGVGGANSQNVTDPRLGPLLLETLRGGATAQQALAAVVGAADPATIGYRQLLVLDSAGRAAAHAGDHALGVFGAVTRENAVAGGNMLANLDVLDALADAALAGTGRIEERLLRGLRAAVDAGGEAGPVHSAGLAVVANAGWRVTDLRVDWADSDPVAALAELLDVWLPQRDAYIDRGVNPWPRPRTGCPAMSKKDVKGRAGARIAEVSGELISLSNQLHADPEPGWQEHRSSAAVAAVLATHGFEIEQPYLGVETAFRAVWAPAGAVGFTVGFLAEYDALPGLGHACGHNLISAMSVGAALAVAAVADSLGVAVEVIGTPAEEGGGGKVVLLNRGAFQNLDLALMAHPAPVDVAEARPFAVTHWHVQYDGQAAHAAAYPERGVNANDAFLVAQLAIALLRQQLPAGCVYTAYRRAAVKRRTRSRSEPRGAGTCVPKRPHSFWSLSSVC
ncbi:M20/M25/M40 family metallo-hydrolase [Leucobacter coleopterorum]|uniref:M20/M25/M40 family metallo-hydrolase n=1 Tax=Leucobacter coleopterorum TaxID=2714933 RepID=UPI0031378963